MKRIITICVTVLIAVGVILFCILNISTEIEQNVDNRVEIKPEEEIKEQDESQTEIKLYFTDSTSNVLVPTTVKVPAKELIKDPYTYVLKKLFEGTNEKKYKNVIPNGSKINNVTMEKGILYIDLSEEFEKAQGSDAIYSIVKTMFQFNEVNKIKFIINGKEKKELRNVYTEKE